MERYETAKLEITAIDEDVIAASVERCEIDSVHETGGYAMWIVYYDDGTSERVGADLSGKPDVCP